MNRRSFLQSAAALSAIRSIPLQAKAKTTGFKIHFLRHATLVVEAGNTTFLVDPMLSAKDAMDPVGNAAVNKRIPMVDLPIDDAALTKLIAKADAIIVTHTHRDHWDARAKELIPKSKTILCQPTDAEAHTSAGFTSLMPVSATIDFKGIKISRTDGQHGTGEIGKKMGHVSGFVLEHDGKRLYIAGDTIWCPEVATALQTYKPDWVVVNAGAAQFLQGDPITMSATDVVNVCQALPSASVIAVHMETVNHCLLTRRLLKDALTENNLLDRCRIPADGERFQL